MAPPAPLAVTRSFHAPPFHARFVALSDDPSVFFTLEEDDAGARVVERDASSFAARSSIPLPVSLGFEPKLLASRDGALLVTHAGPPEHRALRVFDRRGGDAWTLPLDGLPVSFHLRWAAAESLLIATNRSLTGAWVIDTARRAVTDALPQRRMNDFSADGSRYLTDDHDQSRSYLSLCARDGGRQLARWRVGLTVRALALLCAMAESGDVVWCVAGVGTPPHYRFEVRRYAAGFWDPAVVALEERPVAIRACGDDVAAVVGPRGEVTHAVVAPGGALRLTRPDGAAGASACGRFEYNGPSPDGRRAAGLVGVTPVLLDLITGRWRSPDHGPTTRAGVVAPSRDGRQVAVAWEGGEVALLDADTLDARVTSELGAPPHGAAFSPDQRALHVLTAEHVVTLDLERGEERARAALPTALWVGSSHDVFAVSPDGAFALVSVEPDKDHVARWARVELASGRSRLLVTGRTTFQRSPRATAQNDHFFMVDSALHPMFEGPVHVAALDARGGAVSVLSAAGGGDPGDAPPALAASSPHLSPDGHTLIAREVTEGGAQRLLVSKWRERGGQWRGAFPRGAVVAVGDDRFAFLRGDDEAGEVVSDDDGTLSVFDLTTLTELARARWSPTDEIAAGCFVAGGALVLGLRDGRVLRVEAAAAP